MIIAGRLAGPIILVSAPAAFGACRVKERYRDDAALETKQRRFLERVPKIGLIVEMRRDIYGRGMCGGA